MPAIPPMSTMLLMFGLSLIEQAKDMTHTTSYGYCGYDYSYYGHSFIVFTVALGIIIIGAILALLGAILYLHVLGFSRLREHLADICSVKALRSPLIAQIL
jgi:Zn-dependent protease with chaperone function